MLILNCVCCFLFAVPRIGSIQLANRLHILSSGVNYSQRGCSAKPMNSQSKRNDSLVSLAANTLSAGNSLYFSFIFLNWISFLGIV